MYPPHHLGGYEKVWQAAMRALRAAGHEARALTTDHREPGPPRAEEDPDVHRELRWYWREHRFPRMSPPARLRLERHNAKVFDRHLADFRPDVVSWWAMGGMSLSLLSRAAAYPTLAFVQDDWLIYGPRVDGWLRMWGRTPRHAAGAAASLTNIPTWLDPETVDRWIFVSAFTRRRALAARRRIRRHELLHSGFDPAFLDPAPEQEWRWRLLCPGRIDPRKGVPCAIGAMFRLPEQATLTIAGGGDGRHLAELGARATPFGSRVRFTGPVSRDELHRLYGECDAVVFPVEWNEPWGLVPLEAMARGRPVIATGRGGSAEYLRDGENAVLFDAGDAGALAAAVRRLAGDPALRARLRAGGARTAPEHTVAHFTRGAVAAHEAAARVTLP